MTAGTTTLDVAFVTAVRARLAARTEAILDEAAGDVWSQLPHRDLAERVNSLVAARCLGSDSTDLEPAAGLLETAARIAGQLVKRQGPGGLFTGGDNVDSPPDTAFSINDLADAAALLRRLGEGSEVPEGTRLTQLLADLLGAATPALISGGVHTPNHRWELSAALARLHRLAPDPALSARVEQWLAEGVDIDDDGLYSERSALYAAAVSNPSLLAIADTFDKPELIAAVERNLSATVDLLLPDGSVETVMSRRQDQRRSAPLAHHLLPLRRLALLRGRSDLAWAAGLALAQGIVAPAHAATLLTLQPEIAHPLPAPQAPKRERRRHFGAAGLLMDHGPTATVAVFGGSDHAHSGPIRSGLANSPTFLRIDAGTAVLDSVRLTRSFFGFGPFRGNGLRVEEDLTGKTTATLRESATAAYYQPLAPADRDARGRYSLTDEGRFSAAMDFGRRAKDEVTLTTVVRVELTPAGAEVTVDITGPAVDWALELAFRLGGTLSGAEPFGEHTWQLGAAESAVASYHNDGSSISVAILDASDGNGGPLSPALTAPRYEPGEEYEFPGGTDAASGERLYVSGRTPAHVRIRLIAESNPHSG